MPKYTTEEQSSSGTPTSKVVIHSWGRPNATRAVDSLVGDSSRCRKRRGGEVGSASHASTSLCVTTQPQATKRSCKWHGEHVVTTETVQTLHPKSTEHGKSRSEMPTTAAGHRIRTTRTSRRQETCRRNTGHDNKRAGGGEGGGGKSVRLWKHPRTPASL